MSEETEGTTEPTEVPTEPQVEDKPESVTAEAVPEPSELEKREIARRIELGKRKAADKRAEEAERRAIAAEAEAKLLREQQSAKQEKVYSLAEVNAARRAGQITDQVADEYIEKIIIPAQTRAQLEADKAQTAKLAPVQKAQSEISKWIEIMPEIDDRGSEAFQKVAKSYNELIEMGHEDSFATRLTAIRLAHGSLESRQRKLELSAMNRVAPTIATERSGGGSPANGKVDISKAPPTLQAKWDRMGFDQGARERSWKLMQEQNAERARRTGRTA